MQTQERRQTMMQTNGGGHATRPSGSGMGGGVLVGLLALACPLLCLGPVLLVGLAATGLGRALGGAPWPLIAGAVLVVLASGVWGMRARGPRHIVDCCAPARPDSLREVHDENAR